MLDVSAVEVLERTTCCWTTLALVPRTVFCAAVGVLGRTGQPEEAELANPHTGPELDRQGRDVRQLKRHVTAETGVYEASGRVRQQTQPPK
jgi:hypothetical protein